MKNPDIQICDPIESKMNEIIDTVNKMDSAIEADPLHSELRILTAYAEELNLKKEQTSYDDMLDALRLSLKGYNIK